MYGLCCWIVLDRGGTDQCVGVYGLCGWQVLFDRERYAGERVRELSGWQVFVYDGLERVHCVLQCGSLQHHGGHHSAGGLQQL